MLCVGNTLLLNGTVHSPPYVTSAVGADRSRFEADSLVRELKQAAQASGVRVSVARETSLEIPAFKGPTGLRYAEAGTLSGLMARILVIDNYDCFTYNLVQYLGELGAEPVVFRNDEITLDEIDAMAPDGIIISPGPCTPDDAGISNGVIEHAASTRRVPILGVCLGHQCIGQVFGGKVVRAPRVMHGKTSLVRHDGAGVLAGLPSPFDATRYHSLVVERESFPAAWSSPPRPKTTTRSWRCAIASCRSRACSSTPSRSSRLWATT